MEKILSFSTFNALLTKFPAPVMEKTQLEFYSELFSWAYSNNLPETSLSRWCTGTAYVTDYVLKPTADSPMEYMERYREVFEAAIAMHDIHPSAELCALLRDCIKFDPLRLSEDIPESAGQLLARALTEALVNDVSRKTVRVSPPIQKELDRLEAQCKNWNNAFHTPHLLSAIFQGDGGTLRMALDQLKPGLGKLSEERMLAYAGSRDHSAPYEPCGYAGRDAVSLAKKYTLRSKKFCADNVELVRAAFLTDSKTMGAIAELMECNVDKLLTTMEKINAKKGKTSDIFPTTQQADAKQE